MKKRKDKERREDQKKKQSETKHKLHVEKERETERKLLESDPFFSMYQPAMTEQECEDQLSLALSESASIASSYQESSSQSVASKTVWGTKKVATREEELFNEANEWADHIVINKSQRKRRGKKH